MSEEEVDSKGVAADAVEDSYYLHRRFDRVGRLFGDDAMARLFRSHVMVVGLGGVGSYAAEGLARSGVGKLTLVDFDVICVTNSNRQLQALKHTIGKSKAEVLAERLRQINPQGDVRPVREFYEDKNSDRLLDDRPDFIVDAIDNITAKCHLLVTCKQREIPIVASGGASGRVDPTTVRVVDLADTYNDPMLQNVRKILRCEYDFPREGRFGIPTVFSRERPANPVELHYDRGKGFRCVCPHESNQFHTCDKRAMIYGTTGMVTGTFGFACASVVVQNLITDSR